MVVQKAQTVTAPALTEKVEEKKLVPKNEYKQTGPAKVEQSVPSRKEVTKKVTSATTVVSREVEKAPVSTEQKSQKNLEELRAILRSLAKPSSGNGEAPDITTPPAEPTESEQTDKIAATQKQTPSQASPLRSVLAELVSDGGVSHPVPVAQEKELNSQEPQKKEQESGPTPTKSDFHPRSVIEKEAQEEALLSPKKLERMMRVTGGDKNPLS
jgi:hypothetical protein